MCLVTFRYGHGVRRFAFVQIDRRLYAPGKSRTPNAGGFAVCSTMYEFDATARIARSERDGYCAETSFRLRVKRSSQFESAGVSAHSAARRQGGSIWASYDLPLPFQ
jgi:hypothetical protein